MTKSFENTRHFLILGGLAFAFHFVWESIQCSIFFVHGSYDATWWGMVKAAAGDVGLTWTLYGIVAVAGRRWRWGVRPWGWDRTAALVAGALALGVAVELRGLHQGRWSYTEVAPLVPYLDVSVVPLVQLLLLTPLVVVLAERFAQPRA